MSDDYRPPHPDFGTKTVRRVHVLTLSSPGVQVFIDTEIIRPIFFIIDTIPERHSVTNDNAIFPLVEAKEHLSLYVFQQRESQKGLNSIYRPRYPQLVNTI